MVFLLLGVMLWYLGRQTSDVSIEPDIKVLGKINGGFVLLPLWLYFLCGMPQRKNLPYRVVTARSLTSQLTGVLFIVYGYFEYTKRIGVAGPEMFVLMPLVGIAVSYFLRIIYPYRP